MADQTKSSYPDELKKVDRDKWYEAPAVILDGRLIIQGRSVMEPWQKEYMAELARVVTGNRGRILEVGFGLGVSASAIQGYSIDEHVIIESNKHVYKMLEEFAQKTEHKVVPVFGMWQDVIADSNKFHNESFDGILFDASPFNERELYERPFDFGVHAYRLLRANGIYTYSNLTGIGTLKYQYDNWDELFAKTQLPGLQKCGFTDITFKLLDVQPPEGEAKYQHTKTLIPIIIKR